MTVIGGGKVDYEKVAVDEWLVGVIEEVTYDPKRKRRVKDKDMDEWYEKEVPQVRFKFKIDGYEWSHYSRWMTASTNEKSNLYSKYLKYLCPKFDCQDKEIDLELLKGVKVKTMWENNDDYQNITQIRGISEGLNIIVSHVDDVPVTETEAETDEVPF